jgi:hypothetical protein
MPPIVCRPGQPIFTAGLYYVVHHKHRESDTEMFFKARDIFPHCNTCDDLVEYFFIADRIAPGQPGSASGPQVRHITPGPSE